MNGNEGGERDEADWGRNSCCRLAFIYRGKGRSEIPWSVTHATLDPSVKVIGDEAFKDCVQLVEVVLCEGLEKIEKGAFGDCKSLKGMEIPSTVKVVGNGAFVNCDQLVKVELCEGLKQIGAGAFYGCKALKGTKIPPTGKVIGEAALG